MIILSGITQKGKICIKKKGSVWELHAETERVLFNPEVGPWLYVSPYGSTYLSKDAMWIKKINDPDYTIVNKPD